MRLYRQLRSAGVSANGQLRGCRAARLIKGSPGENAAGEMLVISRTRKLGLTVVLRGCTAITMIVAIAKIRLLPFAG
jgi:hypothetical protein